MKRLICFAAVLMMAVLAGCAGREAQSDAQPGGGGNAAPVAVSIDNFTFKPDVVAIPVGGKITWTNRDDVPHTVKSNDGSFTSAALDTDRTFTRVFAAPGEYAYFCSIHPHMTARVIVK
jgi:plastocyanin